MSDAYTFVKRCRVGNASAKLVLYAIAEYANENGVSQPSSARLRFDTELSARTISTALDLLEEKQIIRRERSHTEKGRRAPDRIILRGYRDWLKSLHAKSASCDQGFSPSVDVNSVHVQETQVQQAHMQEIHVQDLHVMKRPQDVVVDEPPDPTSLPANGARAIRQEENNLQTEELLFVVEGAVPKRKSSALRAEAKRVAEELWYTWPSEARKRHTKAQVLAAVEATLANIKLNARGDDLIAAGRRHVAERRKSGAQFVKGLVPFLAKGLWVNWAHDDEPEKNGPVDEAERRRRVANFEFDGSWDHRWGPKPDSRSAAA